MNSTKILFIAVLTLLLISGCSGNNSKKNDEVKTEKTATDVSASFPTYMNAALNGDFEKVKEFIEGGMPVDTTDKNGSTAMMLAAFNGFTEIVEYLLNEGADVNHRDINERTALMYASTGPANETVKLLIKAGADINAIGNQEGYTAIMFAAAEGQTEVFKTLMDAGADITIKDKDGETARDFASKNSNSLILRLIDNR